MFVFQGFIRILSPVVLEYIVILYELTTVFVKIYLFPITVSIFDFLY